MSIRSITARWFERYGIYLCGGTRASNCNEPVSKVNLSRVYVQSNGSNGIYIRGSGIDKATVQHSYAGGSSFNGIRLYSAPGDITNLKISDCTTIDNNSGINIHGRNIINAKLSDNTSCRNSSSYGIRLGANSQLIRPKVIKNTLVGNDFGIYLLGAESVVKITIRDNYVVNNGSEGIYITTVNGQIQGGQVKNNVVLDNDRGIYFQNDLNISSTNMVNVKVQDNQVVDNDREGIRIEGSDHQIKNNIVSDNGEFGILLDGTGQGNKITGNKVIGNGSNGIYVSQGSTNAQIIKNQAGANNIGDLFDQNSDCDSNTWKNNTFLTRNQDCIE